MQMRAIAVVVVMFALAAGCSDSADHLVEQGKVSLGSGRPDTALGFAQKALEQEPNDPAARLIMAKAHLRLRQYPESEKILRALAAEAPADPDPHRELLNLALARMSDALAVSEFPTNAELQESFTTAKGLGYEQADWLRSAALKGEADLGLARLIILDSQRIERFMREEKSKLRMALATDAQSITSPAIEQQKRDVEAMLLTAEKHLQNALDADVGVTQTVSTLTQLMTHRKGWQDLWVFANATTRRKDLAATVAAELVAGVLAIPDEIQKLGSRIELSRLILEAVPVEGRQSPHWKVIRSRLFLLDGRFEEAHDLAQEAHRAQPDNHDAQFMLAWTLYRLNKFLPAKAILERLVTDRKNHADTQTLYGLTLIETGDRALAYEALRHATRNNPNDSLARAAMIMLMRSDPDSRERIRNDVNELYRNNPADPAAIRYKVEMEIERDNRTEVVRIVDSIQKLSPLKPEHMEVLVDALLYLKEHDKALGYALELTRQRPDSADDHLRLVRVRRRTDRTAAAIVDQLRDIQQRFPDHLPTSIMLAREFHIRGQYDGAIELMEAARINHPDHAEVRLLLAQCYGGLSMTEQAFEHVQHVLNAQPGDARAHEIAARLHRLLGQEEQAKEHLAKIDESQFDPEENPGALAHLMAARGDYDAALRVCNAAVAADRADPLVRLILAEVQNKLNNTAEAETQLQAYVRSRPDDFSAYLTLVAFYATRSPDRGMNQLEQLRSGNAGLVTLAKGVLLSRIGRRDEAIAVLVPVFKELVAKQEKLAFAYARLLSSLILAKDPTKIAEAASVYQLLINTKNQEIEARFAQIDLTWRKPDDDATMARLTALAEILTVSKHYQRMQVLARIVRLGRFDDGLRYADRWVLDDPTNAAMHKAKGELLFAQGRVPEAAAAFEASLKLRPDAIGTHERLVQLLITGRDYPAAEAALDRMSKVNRSAMTYALWSKGSMFLELGLNSQAVQTFEQLQKEGEATMDPRANYALGISLAEVGRAADAKAFLARIPMVAIQYPSAQIRLARLDQAAGKVEDAKSRLERLARDPRTAAAAANELFRLTLNSRDDEALLAWSDKAINLDTLSPKARMQWVSLRAHIQASAGDWKGVDETLARAQKQDPTSVKFAAMRMMVLHHLGEGAQARELYNRQPDLAVSDMGVQIALGLEIQPPSNAKASALTACLAALVRSDVEAAREAAGRIGALNNTVYRTDILALLDGQEPVFPARAAACRKLALAIAAMDIGLPQLAETLCRQVIEVDPRLTPARGLLLATQVRLRKPHEVDMQKARAALPGTALATYIASLQEANAGDHPAAIASTLSILQREPGHDHAQFRLYQLYEQSRDYGKAIATLEPLTSRDGPYRVQAANDLAFHLAEHQPKRLEEAYRLAMTAAKASPTSAVISDTLGWIEHLRGNNEAALKLLLKATGRSASASRHYHLGVVYHRLGQSQWARRHLEVAAAGPADHPDAARARDLLPSVAQPKG